MRKKLDDMLFFNAKTVFQYSIIKTFWTFLIKTTGRMIVKLENKFIDCSKCASIKLPDIRRISSLSIHGIMKVFQIFFPCLFALFLPFVFFIFFVVSGKLEPT